MSETVEPKRLTKRRRDRELRAILEAIASCERAIKIVPIGPYQRSLAHWQRKLAELDSAP